MSDSKLPALLEEISYLRACASAAAAAPEGFDFAVLMPRLDRALAALDAVLAAHRDADGRCAWCRNPDGQRQKWPCGEYLAITRELTGGAS